MENKKESINLEEKEYNRLCILVYSVFNNENGKLLFSKLENMFIKQPVAFHEWSERKAYFREGENNTIRALLKMYQFGESLIVRGK